MSVEIVIGGNPKFDQGKLDPGGGKHLDRIQSASLSWLLIPERAGTRATALQIDISRDASQGSAADLIAYQTQFGSGRAEKNAVKIEVFLVDDERKGKPALIGKFECAKTVIVSTKITNDSQPVQVINMRSASSTSTRSPDTRLTILLAARADGHVEEPDGQ